MKNNIDERHQNLNFLKGFINGPYVNFGSVTAG